MPKVQEYLPEGEAQGPVGSTSPMLEQAAMFGHGVEEAARDIGDAASVIRQRQTMAESSDAYAVVSEKRAAMMDQIQQQTNDGTLDDKGLAKIKEDYQSWTEKQYDGYDTAGGRDAFVRASARAGGGILQHAAMGRTVVAGNKAKSDLSTMLNNDSNVVMQDPSQFANLRDAHTEYIQSQVKSGAFSPAVARQVQAATDLEMSKAATRGYMQSDFNNIKASVINSGGKVDPSVDQLNVARKMLDSGGFDQFMDSDQKKGLLNEIRANQSAAQAAGLQVIQQNKIAHDAKGAAFRSQAFEQIRQGTYDPGAAVKAFQAGLITPEEQLQLNHLADSHVTKDAPSNPEKFNELMSHVLSPDNAPGHIADPMQMSKWVTKDPTLLTPGSPYISKGDFDKLTDALGMVPSNKVNSFHEAQLLEQAKAKIGTADPDAHYKLMQFTNELQMAKQNALKKNEPLGPLFDPGSPQFMGNQLSKYIATPQDLLRKQADQVRGQFVPPATVQTPPGVAPPPSAPSGMNLHPDAIGKMNAGDLMKLNPKSLTPEQKAAARARYNQLNRKK